MQFVLFQCYNLDDNDDISYKQISFDIITCCRLPALVFLVIFIFFSSDKKLDQFPYKIHVGLALK